MDALVDQLAPLLAGLFNEDGREGVTSGGGGLGAARTLRGPAGSVGGGYAQLSDGLDGGSSASDYRGVALPASTVAVSEKGFLMPVTNCCVTVPQDRWFAVERFGRFACLLGPGLQATGFDICGLCITLRSISKRVEQNEVTVHTKTQDGVFVALKVAAQHSVIPERVADAMYKLADIQWQISAYVSDSVRSWVSELTLDDAFERLDALCEVVRRRLESEMENFGFQVHKVLVTELMPAKEVRDAMEQAFTQSKLREAQAIEAEAARNVATTVAQGRADTAQLVGDGSARQRKAIAQGLREAINTEGNRPVNQAELIELMMVGEHFDTLKAIGGTSRSEVYWMQGPKQRRPGERTAGGASGAKGQGRPGQAASAAVSTPKQVQMPSSSPAPPDVVKMGPSSIGCFSNGR